jgi:hypothetical protein
MTPLTLTARKWAPADVIDADQFVNCDKLSHPLRAAVSVSPCPARAPIFPSAQAMAKA